MSAAFVTLVDKYQTGFDAMVNGEFLSEESKRLRKIAKSWTPGEFRPHP